MRSCGAAPESAWVDTVLLLQSAASQGLLVYAYILRATSVVAAGAAVLQFLKYIG